MLEKVPNKDGVVSSYQAYKLKNKIFAIKLSNSLGERKWAFSFCLIFSLPSSRYFSLSLSLFLVFMIALSLILSARHSYLLIGNYANLSFSLSSSSSIVRATGLLFYLPSGALIPSRPVNQLTRAISLELPLTLQFLLSKQRQGEARSLFAPFFEEDLTK